MSNYESPGYHKYMALPHTDRIAVARYYIDVVRAKIEKQPDLCLWLSYHPSNFDILMDRYVRRSAEGWGCNEDGQPTYVPDRTPAFNGAKEAWRLTETVYAFRPPNWKPGGDGGQFEGI